MIVFILLNTKSNTLVFSYIHYNELFVAHLILFILCRNELMLNTYKDPGPFLTFIYKSCYFKESTDKLSLSRCSTHYLSDFLSHINSNISNVNYISSALDIINRLTYLSDYN